MKKLALAVVLTLGFAACKNNSESGNSGKVNYKFIKEGELEFVNNGQVIKKIDIEIAETETEKRIGLMDRDSLGENQGMLFIDENPSTQGFWMKRTRIPLDIIYIAPDSTVLNIAKNAQPYLETGIPAPIAAKQFTVEINGGMADKWGITDSLTKIRWKTLK